MNYEPRRRQSLSYLTNTRPGQTPMPDACEEERRMPKVIKSINISG